ncbi:APC family permease [Lolliginicoccus levis]|uniref:APC family permease n=1 Tax=Lolliginicoccus levis TaxID=2919542 RepID=UPI00241ED9D4|nr:APC family permease [Lolliginicoccus levis]
MDGAMGREDTAAPALRRVLGTKLLLLFIVGDILGTGIYALTGEVAAEVGGAAWLPFLVAFGVATITAFSYLELVTKFPHAGGAGVYVHKAFGVHFVTFVVVFAVMASGVTSAATAATAFAANFSIALGLEAGRSGVMLVALLFLCLLAAINLWGVAESVRANVVLTMVELSGLLLVILVGVWAIGAGNADFSRVVVFESPTGKNVFLAVTAATSLAFFAMVGFEDSVNMAEETRDPVRIFPRVMFTGLALTGTIYVLVSLCVVALVPVGELASNPAPLVTVVERGAPGVPISELMPIISMFAVANSALINMMMASRLLYGMARQRVLPRRLGVVWESRRTPWLSILVTTGIAMVLLVLVTYGPGEVTKNLGGTTSLLLLGVFTVVNLAVIVLRREESTAAHFRSPRWLPHVGIATCFFLVTPLSGRPSSQYEIAGWLLLLGVLAWFGARSGRRAATQRSGRSSR